MAKEAKPKGQKAEPVLKGIWGWAAEKLGIPGWGQALILVLFGIFILATPVFWAAWAKLGQLETSVRLLASNQSPQLRDIIRDLLAQAQELGKTGEVARAGKTVDVAAALMASATRSKTTADQSYFTQIHNIIDAIPASAPDFRQSVNGARIALAEYRSALLPRPRINLNVDPVSSRIVIDDRNRKDWYLSFGKDVLNCEAIPSSFDCIMMMTQARTMARTLEEGATVGSYTIAKANQTLDGGTWENVDFVDSHIKYKGGEVLLKNVRFFDCTFDFPDSPEGRQFATFVSLLSSSLTIRQRF